MKPNTQPICLPVTEAEKLDFSKKLHAASATLETLAQSPDIQASTARHIRELAFLCRCRASDL